MQKTFEANSEVFYFGVMYDPKHIIKSLPLLASILGRKYGVQVRIGGDKAFTNGNIIQLPSLPLDCDDTFLNLVRGLIDHESAHIRDTDFDALRAANLIPLEKFIGNTIEDWRVENVLSAVYPGCRENFQWLIRNFIFPKSKKHKEHASDPAMFILKWLLITIRSWDVKELGKERDCLKASVEIHYPGLTHELEPVLRLIPKNCAGTLETLGFACEIANIIRKYAQRIEQQQMQQPSPTGEAVSDASQETSPAPSEQSDAQTDPANALQSLQNILSASADDSMFPGDMGEQLKNVVTSACNQPGERLQVAVITRKLTGPLTQTELEKSRQSTTALRTRLQALMQSIRSVRNHSGYVGALNTHKLHSLTTGNTKVFLRKGEKVGVNAAVHILIDSSGSMDGRICCSQAKRVSPWRRHCRASRASASASLRFRENEGCMTLLSKRTGKRLRLSCGTERRCTPGSPCRESGVPHWMPPCGGPCNSFIPCRNPAK